MKSKLSVVLDQIEQVATEVATRVYGTPSPRSNGCFRVPQVSLDSSLGSDLRKEFRERAPLFLVTLNLNEQDWSADEWLCMLETVCARCTESGLAVRENGTLGASAVVLVYDQVRDYPKPEAHLLTTKPPLFLVTFEPAQNGGARAPGLIFIP